MKKPATLITNDTVVVHLDGKSFTLKRNTEKGQKTVELIKEKNWDALVSFLSPGNAIPKATSGLFTVGEDGQLYTIGDSTPIHNTISKKLLAFLQDGLPCAALVAFWNNLKQNPSKESVEQLYSFLEVNHHPITDDGCFLAYKKVTNVKGELKDSYSKKFNNNIGEIVTMKRSAVDSNPDQTCSHGLHVAAFEYAQGFSGDTLVTVKINPRDVVAVPPDYNQQKMRVCQYEVIEIYGGQEELKTHFVKVAKVIDSPSKNNKTITLSSLTARQAIDVVRKELKNNTLNNMSTKNKQSIVKKALKLFQDAGWTVK